MYVKIITNVEGKGVSNRHGDSNDQIVPREDRMYETESVRYRKYRVSTPDEFAESMKLLGSHSMVGSEISASPETWPERGKEFFVIRLSNGEILVAPSCSLYIMSSEGKTLDGIICS